MHEVVIQVLCGCPDPVDAVVVPPLHGCEVLNEPPQTIIAPSPHQSLPKPQIIFLIGSVLVYPSSVAINHDDQHCRRRYNLRSLFLGDQHSEKVSRYVILRLSFVNCSFYPSVILLLPLIHILQRKLIKCLPLLQLFFKSRYRAIQTEYVLPQFGFELLVENHL